MYKRQIIYRKDRDGVKFLLLYHGKGYWNFPKGKLDPEEKSFKAALREVKEETGLSGGDLRFKDFFKVYDRYFFQRGKDRIFKIVIYYLAETRQSEIKVSSEHEGYGWFLYRDAVRLLTHQNLKNNLKRAHDAIRRKSPPRR